MSSVRHAIVESTILGSGETEIQTNGKIKNQYHQLACGDLRVAGEVM